MTSSRVPLRAAAVCVVLASLLVACGRDFPAPTTDGVTLARYGMLSVEPVFPRLAGGRSLAEVVAFERVRVVLRRADGSVALDTTVFFPPGADSVSLSADVRLAASSGGSGEVFKLDLGYLNQAGEVVFKGGPVDLTVLPKGSGSPPPPIQIPVKYSGPGASAARVVISPRSASVFEGQGFAFGAAAVDASGTVVPNTPVVWASLDPARAVLNASSAGVGRALALRGNARIVAQLLTGPMDTVTVSVSLFAKNLAPQSGDGQKGEVGKALPQPLAVKVTASDGVGVSGVSVNFAVSIGGGSVGSGSVATDASGVASTSWTMGPRSGAQTATASVAGLVGSPVTFTATARSTAPVKLVFAASPAASNPAGTPLRATVHALDEQGDLAKEFSGSVSVALDPSSPEAGLLGTLSATAVEGVASFGDVRINVPNSGYALVARAAGLIGATTGTFAVVPGPAHHLEFAAYPVNGMVAGGIDAVNVIARDIVGNVATTFAGSVTVSQIAGLPGMLSGTLSQSATAGVTSFRNLAITKVGEYQFGASSPGLTDARGPAFPVRAGPAAALAVVSGGGQSASVGTALSRPIIFTLVDRYVNLVSRAGITVTFVASNGGSTSPASATTDATGRVSTSWTLGFSATSQSLVAASAGLSSAAITAMAVAGAGAPGSGGDLILIDDVNALDNAYGTPNPGNAAFIKNLVNFTTPGARSSATKVLSINDGSMYYNFSTNWTTMKSIFQGEGFTTTEVSGPSAHSALLPIPSDVKLVVLNNPVYSFSTTEINSLKSFSSQGGRILFVGENPAYYYEGYRTGVENTLLAALGSSITVNGMCDAPGQFIATTAHQVTTGVTTSGSGSIYMNCASYHTGHGARDVAIGRASSGNVVLSAVTVNTTLLPLPSLRAIVAPDEPTPRTLGPPEATLARPTPRLQRSP